MSNTIRFRSASRINQPPKPNMLEDISQYSKEQLYAYLEQIMQGYRQPATGKQGDQPVSDEQNNSDLVEKLLDAADVLQQDVLEIVKKFRRLNTDLEKEVKSRTEELAIKEANLKALIENTSDIILLVDQDFTIQVANQVFLDRVKLEYGLELEVGVNLMEVCSQKVIDYWLPDFQRARNGESFKILKTFDYEGRKEHFEFSYNPIQGNHGEITGVSFFGKDITEKQTALEESQAQEELLASINHSIKEGIFRTNKGRIIYMNKAFVEMFGYKSVEEMYDVDPYELYIDESKRDYFVELMQKETFFVNEEVHFKRKDHTTFWGLMSSIKVVREDGEVYYDGAIRDVTPLKVARRNLEARNVELTKVNQELDRFVYSSSHDLRAPLVSLQGLINVARMSDTEADRDAYFGLMEKTITKLDGFIQDIIHYSRNSRAELKSEPIDFAELIAESEEELRYMEGAGQTRTSLKVTGSGVFISDPVRLKMVFNNLLSNSIRYRDTSKALNQVAIVIRHHADGVSLRFGDNGQGIADEHLPRIFEMFYRGNQHSQGSGIGLYIVNEAISKLQGEISVVSTIGEGTTFTIELPNGGRIKSEKEVDE